MSARGLTNAGFLADGKGMFGMEILILSAIVVLRAGTIKLCTFGGAGRWWKSGTNMKAGMVHHHHSDL
jgi:hypothetical protein